jgi:hypothetical protein
VSGIRTLVLLLPKYKGIEMKYYRVQAKLYATYDLLVMSPSSRQAKDDAYAEIFDAINDSDVVDYKISINSVKEDLLEPA